MQRCGIPIVLALAVTGTAAAQGSGPTERTGTLVFKRRLADRLDADGVTLSANNLELIVQEVAGKWVVLLVDRTTGRITATSKIDQQPTDHDTMVGALAQAAADLESQLRSRNPPPSPSQVEEHKARVRREVAELWLQCGPLRFGARADVAPRQTNSSRRHWLRLRGSPNEDTEAVSAHDHRFFNHEMGTWVYDTHAQDHNQSWIRYILGCDAIKGNDRRRASVIGDPITASIAARLQIVGIPKSTAPVAASGSHRVRGTLANLTIKDPGIPIALALTNASSVQEPEQAELENLLLLEKRVTEELARDGIVLSQRNLELKIEQLEDRWFMSLMRLADSQVEARTLINQLSMDNEAIVARLTHAIANLNAQIGDGRSALSKERLSIRLRARAILTERQRRILAEEKFRAYSLRIDTSTIPDYQDYILSLNQWKIMRGYPGHKIGASEFYAIIGRPDLARAYNYRQAVMIASYLASGAAFATTTMLTFKFIGDRTISEPAGCHGSPGGCGSNLQPSLTPVLISGSAAIAVTLLSEYFYLHLHSIDEDETQILAEAYNRWLRRKLRLSPLNQHSLLRDISVTPYIATHNAGLALGTKF